MWVGINWIIHVLVNLSQPLPGISDNLRVIVTFNNLKLSKNPDLP